MCIRDSCDRSGVYRGHTVGAAGSIFFRLHQAGWSSPLLCPVLCPCGGILSDPRIYAVCPAVRHQRAAPAPLQHTVSAPPGRSPKPADHKQKSSYCTQRLRYAGRWDCHWNQSGVWRPIRLESILCILLWQCDLHRWTAFFFGYGCKRVMVRYRMMQLDLKSKAMADSLPEGYLPLVFSSICMQKARSFLDNNFLY